MDEPIYFSKFCFEIHSIVCERFICNVIEKELSYQQYSLIHHPQSTQLGTDEKLAFMDGIKLTDEDLANMLPFINARKFGPYRDNPLEPGLDFFGGPFYEFYGFTDSYLPYIHLPMNAPVWIDSPSEIPIPTDALYIYIDKAFVQTGRLQRKGWKRLYDLKSK